ncbi:splicing regulatory glutamine/lysine-rich protein 1 [Ricinus communis]|uniref:Uncharacterized protein n=1 Tax=Ricinus communis TaxID=3988 RepID=B9S7T7_RICCO|nr:splicing regulatory glutamine/lysine-rich protein 1 [Ricinus communis]XP_015576605.1 splicing regulatory glutamine/lysine-rich protein 1 [Ricinus communis]EEF40253.1 conserved hypothetical protein [Ricinus communis]|eukprot:XP_002522053.1 splicing regulatory glutamine/lysine-rich protein 1 [Ricinus communis]
MDLETENRIAAILLREAAELRCQAEKEGVHVYLQKPGIRGRPNSRFLTATVRGVQQANRAVEVNEMWRVRQKELELDDRLKGRSRHESSSSSQHRENNRSPRSTSKRQAVNGDNSSACSSSINIPGNCYSREDEGLRDEEVEEFLHSRVKRGRGAVGSRMDETGPYLPRSPESKEKLSSSLDRREHRTVLGPEKPSPLNSYESSEEELDKDRRKKAKKVQSRSSDKHSKKHRMKERSRDKKKKNRKEKRSKH